MTYGQPYVHAVRDRIEVDEYGVQCIMDERNAAGGDDAMAGDSGEFFGYVSKGGKFLPWPNVVSVDAVAEVLVPMKDGNARIVSISSSGLHQCHLDDDADPKEDPYVKEVIAQEREDLAELLAAFGVAATE